MKYFLKAPWQSERQEVTKEQFMKAKLDFMATNHHLQSPSFVPTQFRSKHGVEGWVEKGRGYTVTRYTCPVCDSNFYF